MKNMLHADERLAIEDRLEASAGQYALIMQGDGNLVLYEGLPNAGNPVWATNTWELPQAYKPTYALMGADGNFVLYNDTQTPAWETGTAAHPGAYLKLQDDRNLVLFGPDNALLWASNTSIPSEVHGHNQVPVGYGKTMIADAVLYRDGRLVVDSEQRNNNWVGGLRGQILVVCVDAGGHAIWVSNVFQCPTRCSVPDPSCASYGRTFFTDQFPAVIGQYTTRLDIYQADNANYVDLRQSIINGIKAAVDIAQAVKDALGQLV